MPAPSMAARVSILSVPAALALAIGACNAPPTAPDPDAPAGPSAALLTQSATTEVLVGFGSMPGAAQIALVQALGGTVTHVYRHVPLLAARIPQAQRQVLSSQPGVAYVEDNFAMHPLGSGQSTDWGVARVEASAAWAQGHTGRGAKVGIFDSGIDIHHPDLRVVGGIDLVGDGNGLDDCQGHGTHVAGIVAARNNGRHTVGVAPDVSLYAMRFADCAWAGATLEKMIQGIEWAIDNGMDVVNMSFGFGIAGLVPVPTLIPPSEAADAAFDAAYAAGVVLVAASGNSSTPYVGWPASYPTVIAVGATDDADLIASFSQWGTDQELTAPGVNNLSSYLVGLGQETSLVIDSDMGRELDAVALEFAGRTPRRGVRTEVVYAGLGTVVEFQSVDCTDRIALMTRGGPSFAEKATAAMDAGCAAAVIHNHTPGNFAGTLGTPTAPDGRAWLPVASISLDDGLYLKEEVESGTTIATLLNIAGNLAVFSGTSMASPHAAGVAALVVGKNPALTPDQVRQVLRASTVDLATPGWDPVFGYGLVNARRAVEMTP